MLTLENNIFPALQIVTLSGAISGIDALEFRDNTSAIIKIQEGQLHLDLSQIVYMDLTGFNAIVMLKKEALKRDISLLITAPEDNPVHEYIHLSKLSFHCINRSSI